jgi:hypothetical protein
LQVLVKLALSTLLIGGMALGASGAETSRPAGRILIVRGIFNVFSLGMDQLACRLSARGYRVDVAPPSLAYLAAEAIEKERRSVPNAGPMVIVGHSLGGRFCCSIPWRWRARGLSVNLAVILDSNPRMAVPDNVRRCINLYVTNQYGVFHGQDVWAVDSRTDLVNLDMTKVDRPPGVAPVDHFSIDDSAWIQHLVIEEIDRVFRRKDHCRAAANAFSGKPRFWHAE